MTISLFFLLISRIFVMFYYTPYKRILLIERITKSGGKREFMEALIRIKHLLGL